MLRVVIITAALMIAGVTAGAADTVRTQEITQCLSDEQVTWNDGRDRPAASSTLVFAYSHENAPAWFDEAIVRKAVERAVAEWSRCGVRGVLADDSLLNRLRPDIIRVQWGDKGSGGNFGLANLTRKSLSLGPKPFELLRKRNPKHDATETLQMVISHEMGHFFGLMAHSRRCVDVLSYYNNGKGETCYSRDPSQLRSVVEYRHTLPTACDIERCRKVNGLPPLVNGRL